MIIVKEVRIAEKGLFLIPVYLFEEKQDTESIKET